MPKGSGLTKPMKLSADLADIVGKKEASRAECIKQLWAYIKKNNLQDPENKQFFTPDKKMAKVIIHYYMHMLRYKTKKEKTCSYKLLIKYMIYFRYSVLTASVLLVWPNFFHPTFQDKLSLYSSDLQHLKPALFPPIFQMRIQLISAAMIFIYEST